LTLLQDQGYIEWTRQSVRLLTNKNAESLRLDLSFVEQRQEADYRRLGELLDYLTTERCRRAAILRYFGERVPVDHNCGACDICQATRPTSRPASGVLDPRTVVLAAVRDLQKRGLGRSGIAKVLAGSQSRQIKELKLDASPHYGKLARLTRQQITEEIDRLISVGELRLLPGPYPAVVLASPSGKPGPEGKSVRPQALAPQEQLTAAPPVQARSTLNSNQMGSPSSTADFRPQTSGSHPQTPNLRPSDQSPQSLFSSLPDIMAWAILRVIQTQDGELSRSGVAHFLRGTTEINSRSTYGKETLPGFRFLAQYAHQELLRAVDQLVERKLLVVEATEHLYLWLTQRGKAAMELLKDRMAQERATQERSV